MFTGLIEEIGSVKGISRFSGGMEITISSSVVIGTLSKGDSVAVDGVCQTVTALGHDFFTVQAVGATLIRTTFEDMRRGKGVNLERAVAAEGRLDGHLVQGHVEGIGRISGITRRGDHVFMRISVSEELGENIIPYGSVAVDGVSLTVAEISSSVIGISVIPHTLENSTLGERKQGDRVNIETDFFARYMNLYVRRREKRQISESILKEWGY